MPVSDGQLVFAHKGCRKNARKAGLKQAIRESERQFALEQRIKAVNAVL